VESVSVVCPGFAVDCLETLEEIALRYREDFLAAGGRRFDYVPALNASPAHAQALAALVARETAGWPEALASYSSPAAQRKALERAERARRQGASE